jgi:predicted Rossmann fold flavoprotein
MTKLLVIGGGAAGIFCAVNAARMHPQLQVILVEKGNKLLSKVKISGGGRCNLTHNCNSISIMASAYPRGEKFVKRTFQHFFTHDTISWFEQRGVPIKAEDDGRMFPLSNNSQSVIDALLKEASQYHIQVKMSWAVNSIQKENNMFTITNLHGEQLQSDYLLIATGGFNKTEQFNFITKLGHQIAPPVPSLFTFNIPNHNITQLMGVVATNAQVKINGTKLIREGVVLITHWGLSGPAVLALSAYAARILHDCNYKYTVQVNWCSEYNETTLLGQIRIWRNTIGVNKVSNKNPLGLANRLWLYLLEQSEIDSHTTFNQLTSKQQNLLSKNVCSFTLQADGKSTYKDEFVSAGGVLLSEIESSTCESKLIPNLFFAGEVMDVDGRTGGFNFQHAWTSGYIAAAAIAKRGA